MRIKPLTLRNLAHRSLFSPALRGLLVILCVWGSRGQAQTNAGGVTLPGPVQLSPEVSTLLMSPMYQSTLAAVQKQNADTGLELRMTGISEFSMDPGPLDPNHLPQKIGISIGLTARNPQTGKTGTAGSIVALLHTDANGQYVLDAAYFKPREDLPQPAGGFAN